MHQDWRTISVAEIASKEKYSLCGGPFGSKLGRKDYIPQGIPVIRGSNLSTDGTFSFEDFVFVSEQKADELIANTAYPGDLVFTQRGTLGQVGLLPKESEFSRYIVSQSQMKLTVDTEKMIPYFVFLHFRLPATIEAIKNRSITSGVPHINLEIFSKLQVPYPPLNIQEQIVKIISAYDDLIDNNNRRIALLEEAIHRLYREWFVHLRFPGHEHTPVVAGVPEGWEKRPLAEIAHINAESIRKNDAPENIEYIDISSVGTGIINEIKAIDFADAPSRARRIVKHGDIIWSTVRPGNRAYSLILNPNPNTIASTGFAVLTAQIVPFTFLYQAVITDEFVEHMAKVAKGAAYPAVSTSDFEKVNILIPSQLLLDEFEQMAKPIAQQTQTLRLQNEKLREARDSLLPRLMNGSLAV